MALNPSPVTIANVFNKKYEVDFYQREYKWNDQKQSFKPIKSLLDDIFYRFNLCYRPDLDATQAAISQYDWYYLNSYMINSVNGKTFIVDGQQRLTTLTILIMSLIHLGEKLGIDKGALDFLKSRVCGYSSSGEKEFWVGFDDRKTALENILEYGLDGESKHQGKANVSEKNIYEAYRVIYEYLQLTISNKHQFKSFQLYLFERVMLVAIDVDDSKDVAMAFEVINDRGIPLTAYEILKGKLLGIIDKSEVTAYVDSWNKSIEEILEVGDEKDIDVFFSTYFRSKFAENQAQYRELETDKYHKTIYLESYNHKIGFKHDTDPNKYFITNVKKYVKETLPFYSELFSRILNDEYFDYTENEFVLFNAINEQAGHYYTLLSAISLHDPDLEEKYVLVAKLFDRNYSLLNLTGSYRSNSFNDSVIRLGTLIRNKSINEIKLAFDQHLLNDIKNAHNRADLKELFMYELFSRIGYNDLPKRFSRYLFARIDNFIAKETKIPTADYYQMVKQAQGKNKHDIEHILTNRDENIKLFNSEEEFYFQRNRLGGLVLLKSSNNRSSKDELYPNKVKTYSGSGTIFARTLTQDFYKSNPDFIKFTQKYQLNFQSYISFGEKEIEERHKLIYDLCKLIWEV